MNLRAGKYICSSGKRYEDSASTGRSMSQMLKAQKYPVMLLLVFSFVNLLFPASQEITIPEGTRISLQLSDHLSTKLNNEGDAFTAKVIAPVYVGDRVAIAKGSVVTGSVSRIVRPGRFRGKAVMNLLFQSIRIPGHAEITIPSASLVRVDAEGNAGVQPEGGVAGEGSTGRDTARVLAPGAAGAGIGTAVGGVKGTAIGAGVGIAAGLITVFATRGKDLEMRRGTTMDIALDRPLVIPPESDR